MPIPLSCYVFLISIVILDTFRKMSCYITQDDRIQTLLTVLENMRIASDFKLGDQLTKQEKEARVSAKYTNYVNVASILIVM